jgi:hypothetical protein
VSACEEGIMGENERIILQLKGRVEPVWCREIDTLEVR